MSNFKDVDAASLSSQAPTIVETTSACSVPEKITVKSTVYLFDHGKGLQISFRDPYDCDDPSYCSDAWIVCEDENTFLKVTRPSTHPGFPRVRVYGVETEYLSTEIVSQLKTATKGKAIEYMLSHVPIADNGRDLFKDWTSGNQGTQMGDWPVVFRLKKSLVKPQ